MATEVKSGTPAAAPAPAEPKPAEEEELGEVVFEGKKKKKPGKKAAAAAAASATDGTAAAVGDAEKKDTAAVPEEKDYTYKELLDRIVDLLNKGEQGGAKVAKVPVPQLGRIGTKRTCLINFKEIANSLHRPTEHLMSYMQVELGGLASIDGEGKLVVKGRFQNAHIEKVLKHYIREYVICKVCKSYDTTLEKENRLNFVKCGSCNSRLSVSHIRQGFQAQIGKRKQT